MAALPRGDRSTARAARPISGSSRSRRRSWTSTTDTLLPVRSRVTARSMAAALAGVTIGALAAVLLAATPARAHSDLVSSSPADGAVLAAAPSVITLTFSENVLAAGSSIVANGADGRVTLGPTQVSGPQVSALWPPGRGGGRYTVSYRVVSADGHPITGTVSFSYADAASSPAASSPAASSPAASSPAASSPAASSSAPTVSPAASSSEGGSSGTALVLIGGLALVALVAAVAVSLTRRRS